MGKETNIWAGDIIHLATAKDVGADIIITTDTFFLKEGEKFLKNKRLWKLLRICLPEHLIKTLTELGFKV